MAAPKRTEEQIIEDRRMVAQLRAEGYSLGGIITYFHNQLDRPDYTRSMVEYDWAQVRGEWAAIPVETASYYLHQQLSHLDTMLLRAWDNYRDITDQMVALGFIDETTKTIDGDSEHTRRVSRKALFDEQKYWWSQITDLNKQRAAVVGLMGPSLVVNVDNRRQQALIADGADSGRPTKAYVSFNPDEWPALGDGEVVVDGIYESVDQA